MTLSYTINVKEIVSLKTAGKVLNIFGKPINFDILLASLLTSLALLMTNFLSEKYLVRFHLKKFLNNYNSYILIVFFVSLFLIVIHFGSKKRKEKMIRRLIICEKTTR